MYSGKFSTVEMSSFPKRNTWKKNRVSETRNGRRSHKKISTSCTKRPKAHSPEWATADMQMLCNSFQILSLQLMKDSLFEQFMVLKKKNVLVFFFFFFSSSSFIIILPYMCMAVIWKTLNPISTVGAKGNLVITKTLLFKYIENVTSKNWKFSDTKTPIFFIFLLKT